MARKEANRTTFYVYRDPRGITNIRGFRSARRKRHVEARSNGHERSAAYACVDWAGRVALVVLNLRPKRRGVADPRSSRDAAAYSRSRAEERNLPLGRSRYNNCFIVHSLSLTRALYVSTVSDRFA